MTAAAPTTDIHGVLSTRRLARPKIVEDECEVYEEPIGGIGKVETGQVFDAAQALVERLAVNREHPRCLDGCSCVVQVRAHGPDEVGFNFLKTAKPIVGKCFGEDGRISKGQQSEYAELSPFPDSHSAVRPGGQPKSMQSNGERSTRLVPTHLHGRGIHQT